jgi:hypothetical protein
MLVSGIKSIILQFLDTIENQMQAQYKISH